MSVESDQVGKRLERIKIKNSLLMSTPSRPMQMEAANMPIPDISVQLGSEEKKKEQEGATDRTEPYRNNLYVNIVPGEKGVEIIDPTKNGPLL